MYVRTKEVNNQSPIREPASWVMEEGFPIRVLATLGFRVGVEKVSGICDGVAEADDGCKVLEQGLWSRQQVKVEKNEMDMEETKRMSHWT